MSADLFPSLPRICGACHRTLPCSAFNRRLGTMKGLQANCRECSSTHSRQRYESNPHVRESVKSKNIAQRATMRRLRDQAMADRGGVCASCGFDDTTILQWHHRDPSSKSFNIADTLSRATCGEARLLEEIAKCDLLCPNCHMRHEQDVRKGLRHKEHAA